MTHHVTSLKLHTIITLTK